jgi:phosphate starvation-inducible PhoH-like protein
MAKRLPAKRANRANPRVDRTQKHIDNILDFGDFQPNTSRRTYNSSNRRDQRRNPPTEDLSLDTVSYKTKKLEIIPRNIAQENYVDTLADESKAIVFAMGPAGTGKTMLATQYAIKALMEGKIDKIIITRPAVSVDENHGFLPGTLIQKMAPWVVPIIDVFKEVYSVQTVEKMLENEVISIAPLAFLRGRTFKSSIVICDEMQNATPSQMKMLLTRIGDNSRMFITGDRQHDRGFEANGLKDFVERLSRTVSNTIAVCEFGVGDVERHPVIEEVLRIYDREVD